MIESTKNSMNAAQISPNQEIKAPQKPAYGVEKPFPKHWGNPPSIQTCDWVEFPEGYGHGSGTVRNWIIQNLKQDSNQADQL